MCRINRRYVLFLCFFVAWLAAYRFLYLQSPRHLDWKRWNQVLVAIEQRESHLTTPAQLSEWRVQKVAILREASRDYRVHWSWIPQELRHLGLNQNEMPKPGNFQAQR